MVDVALTLQKLLLKHVSDSIEEGAEEAHHVAENHVTCRALNVLILWLDHQVVYDGYGHACDAEAEGDSMWLAAISHFQKDNRQ